MEKPGVCVPLCLILFVQVALWTVPSAAVDLGESCSHAENCTVANATCNGTNCVCEDTHYQENTTSCLERVDPGDGCTADDKCVANAVCDGSPKTCQCGAGFYVDGQQCSARVDPGDSCTADDQCVANAVCDGSPKTCQCGAGFYVDGLQCSARMDPGDGCTADDQCVANAVCDGSPKTCQCGAGFYVDGQQCSARVDPGDSCTADDQCVANAVCDGSPKTCQCGAGFYVDGQQCSARVDPGDGCTADDQCVANAVCDGSPKTCQCGAGFYVDGQQCSARVDPGDSCTADDQCVANAVCDGSPKTWVDPGDGCTADDQCVANAVCDGSPKTCQCGAGFYVDGQQCSARVDPGDSCTADDQCVANAVCDGSPKTWVDPGDSCTADDQCVANAVCDGSPKTCQCGAGFYVDGQQCSARISPGSGLTCNEDDTRCIPSATCETSSCKYRVGETCPSGGADNCQTGSECTKISTNNYRCKITAGSDLNCNGDSTQCVPSAVCEGTTCKTLLNQPCSGTSPDHCQRDTLCVDVGNNQKQCRRTYDSTCTDSNECQNTNHQDCLSYDSSSQKKCLCASDYFRQKTPDICKHVNNLQVRNMRQSDPKMETSITATWEAPTALNGADAEYRASLTEGSQVPSWSQWSSTRSASFHKLTPGTQYSVSVTTRTRKDPNYEPMEQFTSSQSVPVYTKPGMPGELVDATYAVPSITLEFHPSDGVVQTYEVTVEGTTKTVFGQASSLSASFTIQSPERTYQVSIVAISNQIRSETRTESFFVDSAGAGQVSALDIPQHGGRWGRVTWRKPSEPNGDMRGYSVKFTTMAGKFDCKSGVAVFCSDCTYNVSDAPSVMECAAQSSINLTSAQLESASQTIQVNVTDLQPDVAYKVRVNAYNQKGRGADTDGTVTTDQEAALSLQDLTLTTPESNVIQVRWTPGERTGPTDYTVTWKEKESLTSNNFVLKENVTVTGYDKQDYKISGLLSYWTYEVSVFPFTPVADPPAAVTTETTRTTATAPAAVVSLNISQPGDSAMKVRLSAECPAEKQRNGPIQYISYIATITKPGVYNKNAPEGNISVSSVDCRVTQQEIDVDPEAEYGFYVFARTPSDDGMRTPYPVSISARPPSLERPVDGSDLVGSGSSTTSSVTLDLSSNLFSRNQGTVTLAGIIMCSRSSSESCQSESGTQLPEKYDNLPTWNNFKKNSYRGRYQPTSADFLAEFSRRRRSVFERVARAVNNGRQYIVGDEKCDQDATGYCNGPLPDGREFVVIIWVCTEAGCTEADGVTVKTKAVDDEPPVGAIVGAVIAVLVVATVVVVVVMWRRKSLCFGKHVPHVPIDTFTPAPIRKPIKLKDFAMHLERLHRDSNLLFQEEYEDIQDRSPKEYTQEAALLDANKVKNRYVNILPYDHTRVKLNSDDDDDTSDFINANYIPGYTSPREYIATQGPMVGTVSDFWRMVWEQKSSLIIMLSDLQEKGRPKVDMYWPGELHSPIQYDDIVVEMTTSSTLNKYTIRTFNVYKEDFKEDVRRVVQYFIPGWEDYSANLSPDDVLDFISSTRQEARSSQGPIVVHCSAGVGRTGTFIALDFLMQFVQEHTLDDEVDIFNLVVNMRHNRPLMVQSEKQYIFIHDTLAVIIDRKIRAMHEDNHIYGNTGNEDIYMNQAFEPEENLYENTGFKPTTAL